MITVEHLTKYYGDHLAVDDLSFEISDGHIYGFLGPNGAGKSTTMNIMTGCLSATEGHILIDGHDIFDEPLEAKRLIGYLPEQPPLYLNETPLDYLTFVGRAKGLRGEELSEQIEQVLEQTGTDRVKNRRIGALSKGYKQRVGIAQALLGNPKVIILDEPTVGLDPIQIIEIRNLIKSLGEHHTVVFSSHILSEVQSICDQIVMISHGKLAAYDTPAHLEQQLRSSSALNITAQADEQDVRRILDSVRTVTGLSFEPAQEDGYCRAVLHTDLPDPYELSRGVFQAFASGGYVLLEMELKRANLEDIFLELAEAPDKPIQNAAAAAAPDKKETQKEAEV